MKKETIHYISDIKYFSVIRSEKYSSKKEMLKAHINYIKKKSVEVIGDEKIILKTAELLDKKENSRVALSFHVAIPNDVKNYKDFMNEVIEFFSEKFDIDKQNFFAVLHETHELSGKLGTENKHIHIVANTRTRKDKQIRLQPKDLRQLHKDWDKFLENKGYSIKRDDVKLNFGIEIRKDKELQELYKMYLQTKRKQEKLENVINQKPAPEQPKPSPTYSQFKPEPKPQEPKQKPEQKATNKERAIFETYSYIEGQNKNIIVVVSDIDDYISAHDVKQNEVSYIILNGAVNDFIKSMKTLAFMKDKLDIVLLLNKDDKDKAEKIIDSLKGIRNIGIKVGVFGSKTLYDAINKEERVVLKTVKKPDEPEPPEPPDEPRGPRGPAL